MPGIGSFPFSCLSLVPLVPGHTQPTITLPAKPKLSLSFSCGQAPATESYGKRPLLDQTYGEHLLSSCRSSDSSTSPQASLPSLIHHFKEFCLPLRSPQKKACQTAGFLLFSVLNPSGESIRYRVFLLEYHSLDMEFWRESRALFPVGHGEQAGKSCLFLCFFGVNRPELRN